LSARADIEAPHELRVVVIGGGLVGLASAVAIADRGATVAVVERHPRPGMETSTHNSGVIHAGLYYPARSLKARLCVEGAERLRAFAAQANVPTERCGKFVVAGDQSEVAALDRLLRMGTANGVRGLEVVDAGFVRAREPHVRAVAALWSPNSGIIEPEALVRALVARLENAGGILLRGAALAGAEQQHGRWLLRLDRETVAAEIVVNAAGLAADEVSAMLGGEDFTIYPCRGEYAELAPSRRNFVRGLVYPLPDPSGHGLGVHLTKTTHGSVLLGPTIRYQAGKADYEGDRLPLEAFVEPTRRLLPGVSVEDLRYGGSGIRAKLHPPEESFADFMIRPDRRQPSLLHAAGIDSPGLTSCLAIGELVAQQAAERL
jgi:L-2-hydroxyglutarate oxidase LhgO